MTSLHDSLLVKRPKYDLEDRSRAFASCVRAFLRKLPKDGFTATDIQQVLRSSGSVAANYIEANESLGRKDFLMRIRICLKEAKESVLWLQLIGCDRSYLNEEREKLIDEAEQLVKIFSAILRSTKKHFRTLGVGA